MPIPLNPRKSPVQLRKRLISAIAAAGNRTTVQYRDAKHCSSASVYAASKLEKRRTLGLWPKPEAEA